MIVLRTASVSAICTGRPLGVKYCIQSDSTRMSDKTRKSQSDPVPPARGADTKARPAPRPREIGGPKGPEPTRYGDWEKGGRCIDF